MPFNIGPMELVIILAICLIIFGAGKLPGVGRALGQSIREFKDATQSKGSADEVKAESQESQQQA